MIVLWSTQAYGTQVLQPGHIESGANGDKALPRYFYRGNNLVVKEGVCMLREQRTYLCEHAEKLIGSTVTSTWSIDEVDEPEQISKHALIFAVTNTFDIELLKYQTPTCFKEPVQLLFYRTEDFVEANRIVYLSTRESEERSSRRCGQLFCRQCGAAEPEADQKGHGEYWFPRHGRAYEKGTDVGGSSEHFDEGGSGGQWRYDVTGQCTYIRLMGLVTGCVL